MEHTFHVPFIKDSKLYKKLCDLSKNELLKVIELGIVAYENTSDQKHRWDNNEFNERLEKVEQDYNNNISELMEKHKKRISEKDELLREKTVFFENKKKEMYTEINSTTDLKYKQSIEFKTKQVEEMQKELSEIKKRYTENFQKWAFDERMRQDKCLIQHKKEMEELRNKYEKKIEDLHKIVQSIQMVQENSSLKGQVGENKMFNTLTMLFPKNEIEDTHSTPNRGDFIIHLEGEKKILIDNKDYKNNVPKKEIDKFYQDMETNADIHGGVLMSNTCGIAKKEDFSIDIVAGKPVIYLHHTNNNESKIKSAIEMVSSIIKSKGIDFSNVDIAKKIKDYASTIKRKISKIRRDLKKYEETMISTILDIENTVKNVFVVTKTKY